MRVESQTILTIHNNVITRNYRIGLSQSDNRKWELQIRQALESDRGAYMCQIKYVQSVFYNDYKVIMILLFLKIK